MALGRSLFIFVNHGLWRAAQALFQLPAADAYLLFKYAVILQCPLAVIACWTLARELTKSFEAATIAALLIATSPAYVVYSGQVMTEIPSLLIAALALYIHLRGLRKGRVWMMLAGAAMLGLGVNVREPVAFYAPWLVIAPFVCGPKSEQTQHKIFQLVAACLVFLVFAFGPFILWFWTNAYGFRDSWYGWRESMLMESARHPVRPANVLPFLLYFFLAAPPVFLSLPFAFFKEWRERRFSCLLMMGAVGLWANLLLIFNYSTVVNWRYFLTGLPALAPLAGLGLLRWRALRRGGDVRRAFLEIVLTLMLSAVAVGIYAQFMSREFSEMRRLTRDYSARLALVPPDAVMIAGGQTVAVTYYRGIGMGRWEVIGTGGGWPGPALVPVIERFLQQGRRVFLDADTRWWSVCGWQLEETRAISGLESRFRFRRISDTIFELRPLDDATANDRPDLQTLLPENRPLDTKKCTKARRWLRDEG